MTVIDVDRDERRYAEPHPLAGLRPFHQTGRFRWLVDSRLGASAWEGDHVPEGRESYRRVIRLTRRSYAETGELLDERVTVEGIHTFAPLGAVEALWWRVRGYGGRATLWWLAWRTPRIAAELAVGLLFVAAGVYLLAGMLDRWLSPAWSWLGLFPPILLYLRWLRWWWAPQQPRRAWKASPPRPYPSTILGS